MSLQYFSQKCASAPAVHAMTRTTTQPSPSTNMWIRDQPIVRSSFLAISALFLAEMEALCPQDDFCKAHAVVGYFHKRAGLGAGNANPLTKQARVALILPPRVTPVMSSASQS